MFASKITKCLLSTAILSYSICFAADFTEEELCYMPASLQIELFKAHKLSPVDVLKAQVKQVKKHNREVNCVTFTHYDEALKQAQESEQRYKDGTYRPLEGITVGIKDEHGMKGWVVTAGSFLHKYRTLKETDPMVENLLEAGAVLPFQTTVPEFYLHTVTWTDLWGITHNPWNLKYTVGGSSGGSGAALAAGFCTLATGSDVGGSISIPCAFDGLYGFKPPYGRVATSMPLVPISGSGPMARTFEDMIRMYNVIAGPHESSHTTIHSPHEIPLKFESIKGMKIAYSVDQGWVEVDEDTKKNFLQAVEGLKKAGADIQEVKLSLGLDGDILSELFAKSALSGPLGAMIKKKKGQLDQMTTYGRYFTNKAASGNYGAETALEYENAIKDLHSKIDDQVWQQGYQVLLMPTLATSNVPADFDFTSDKMVINGKEVNPIVGWTLTSLFNILNWYPVINVPIGRNENGVPIGMQIIGNSYNDIPVFRVASSFSRTEPQLYKGNQFPDFKK